MKSNQAYAAAALPLPDHSREIMVRFSRIMARKSEEEMEGHELMFTCRCSYPEIPVVTGSSRSADEIMYCRRPDGTVHSKQYVSAEKLSAETVRSIIALGVTDDEEWRVHNFGPAHPSEADTCRRLEEFLIEFPLLGSRLGSRE